MSQCNKCLKIFTYKYNLKKHLTKKIPCVNNKFNKTCSFCKKEFATVQTYRHHIDGRCRLQPKPEQVDQAQIQTQVQTQTPPTVEELKREIDELKNTIKNMVEKNNNPMVNSNNTNTNNSNNTINITINPYNKPANYLDNTAIKKILNKGYKSVPELITQLHFNSSHPENHNLFIGNKKDWLVSYFDGSKWVLSENTDILDQLYDNNSEYLIGKYDELVGELDEYTLKKFGRYKKDKDDDSVCSNNKKEIKFILYNKKHIVSATKKNN